MKIYYDISDIKAKLEGAVITIGNFDGVHIGHQTLFKEVMDKAKRMNGTSIAMTFNPHPLSVLKKNYAPPIITPFEQKSELIKSTGMDVLIAIPFSQKFAKLSAKSFIEDILIDRIGVKALIVGPDYTFGNNREGNIDLLKQYSRSHNLEVIIPDWVKTSNPEFNRISSTVIRKLVLEGDIEEARTLLGRHYQIRGKVESGRNRGARLLGFPTANIYLDDELCPKTGVYAVTVESCNRKLLGVANIGYSPTFDDHIFTVEVHILDFNEQIYNQKIRVNFIKRLRDEEKFQTIDELKKQIHNDIKVARNYL